MRWLCKIFPCKWRTVWSSETATGTCLVCIRCRANGWLL